MRARPAVRTSPSPLRKRPTPAGWALSEPPCSGDGGASQAEAVLGSGAEPAEVRAVEEHDREPRHRREDDDRETVAEDEGDDGEGNGCEDRGERGVAREGEDHEPEA